MDYFALCGVADVVERNWKERTFATRQIAAQKKGIIDFLDTGNAIVSCGLEKSLFVTRREKGDVVELLGHEHHVCAVSLCSGKSLLAACSYDATISLWDTRNFEVLFLCGKALAVLTS